MHTHNRPRFALAAILLGAFLSLPTAGLAANTAWTYQGRLKDGGAPAEGAYDFLFKLFDASAGGAQMGGNAARDDVAVAEGLFTVQLDFGDQFNGSDRWLEVAVRPGASAAAYTVLSPRQRLTPVPYAIKVAGIDGHSLAAADGDPDDALFVDNAGNVGIGTVAPLAKLDVAGTARMSGFALPIGAAAGRVLTSDAAGAGTWQAQAASLPPSGPAGGGLTGSYPNPLIAPAAVSASNVNPLGAAPGQSLMFSGAAVVWANPPAVSLLLPWSGSGAMGNPNAVFKITNTSSGYGVRGDHSGTGNFGALGNLSEGVYGRGSGGGTAGVYGENSSGGNSGFLGGSLYGAQGRHIASGNLGTLGGSNAGVYGLGSTASAGFFEVTSGNSANAVEIDTNGNSSSQALYARHTGTGDCAVFEITNAASTAETVEAVNAGTGHGGLFQITNVANAGSAVWAQTTGTGNAVKGYHLGTGGNAGDFQINNASNGSTALYALTNGTAGAGYFQINRTTSTASALYATTNGAGNAFYAVHSGTSNNAGEFTISNAANASAALYVSTAGTGPALRVAGTARCDVIEITGADVAEKFPVSDKPEPGMVVEIDPQNAGKLRTAQGDYNRRVAGVVSGAGDIPVGAVLGHLPGVEDAAVVALTGRVWVYCDASSGAIEPGDLLTTSEIAGHAMKALDQSRAPGAVLGKAMTRLESGRGLVLVLVSLQ